ncbi:hypothetical protein [Tetragenococcus solitarius]|uniref:Uncharacterized protein n=1 Tax=Tetragenococcus solitarius TaxID=71453 RepID=A0ABN3Y4F9_9ENTE|nr:hypothetical protein [Tetragenococcus solitarius]
MSEKENKSRQLQKTKQNDRITDPYYQEKAQSHDEIVSWIASAEKELADLRLRKTLLENDFSQLLSEYRRLIITDAAISTIAKTSLLSYLTYELLKPLNDTTLNQTSNYNVWQAKYFLVKYQLTDKKELALSFKMNVIDPRFEAKFMPLILLDLQKMTATVDERQVLELIRLWYSEKIFSRNQLTLINYDLNRLLANFKQLGFDVSPSLLDNTRALSVNLESDFPLETRILDAIFITTMDATEYDFDKIGQDNYQVKLNQEQNVFIKSEKNRTHLFIDSNNRRRSILDFFTHYPFFVPLIVRE